ncbi:MAG: hypothetical protein Fues2KO_01310 [Fuerstiella sp.]
MPDDTNNLPSEPPPVADAACVRAPHHRRWQRRPLAALDLTTFQQPNRSSFLFVVLWTIGFATLLLIVASP